jgi:hypothetical protein
MSGSYYSRSSARRDRNNEPQCSYNTTSNDAQNDWNDLRHQQTQYGTSSSHYGAEGSGRYQSRHAVSPFDPCRGYGGSSPVSPLSSRRRSPVPSSRYGGYEPTPSSRRRDNNYDAVGFAQASSGLDSQYFISSSRRDTPPCRDHSYTASREQEYPGYNSGGYASRHAERSSRYHTDRSPLPRAESSRDTSSSDRYEGYQSLYCGDSHGRGNDHGSGSSSDRLPSGVRRVFTSEGGFSRF